MKKWVLAVSLAFASVTAVGYDASSTIEAQAKDKQFSKEIVKQMKQQKLPQSKGKIGMTYKTFNQKMKGKVTLTPNEGMPYYIHETNQFVDCYFFDSTATKKAKIIMIERIYRSWFDTTSVKKAFGKPYKTYTFNYEPYERQLYKVGKLYGAVINTWHVYDYNQGPQKGSNVMLGTKKALLEVFEVNM